MVAAFLVDITVSTYYNISVKSKGGNFMNDNKTVRITGLTLTNDMPIEFKRGVCCYRKEVPCIDRLIGYKKEWILDKECPIFSQDRNYIEQHIQRKDS